MPTKFLRVKTGWYLFLSSHHGWQTDTQTAVANAEAAPSSLTCRTRRIKCDEERPICRNCAKGDRSCRYNLSSPKDSPSAGAGSHASHQRPNLNGPTAPIPNLFGNTPPPAHNTVQLIPRGSPPVLITSTQRPARSPWLTEYTALQPPPHPSAHPVANLSTVLQNATTQEVPHSPDREGRDISSPPTPTRASTLSEPVSDGDSIPTPFRVPDPIQLSDVELLLFRNFVDRISKWVDSFSHDQPFYCQVPSMALHCPMLLHSCLAASAKQLSRVPSHGNTSVQEKYSLFYYQQALREMGSFLVEPRYSGSDELLASSIILSTYEIIDVAGESFGSHLKGIASLIQSHGIHGDESGIRGATYWTWYRHEVWAAFQSGRRMFLDESYWRPKPLASFAHISMREIANRVLFIFGQCITYYVLKTDETTHSNKWLHIEKELLSSELNRALEDWKEKLPPSMKPFCSRDPGPQATDTIERDLSYMFPFVWFAYPESAISHQLYHASKILLLLNSPCASTTDPLQARRELEKSRKEVLTIANSGINEAWGLISTQCLYIAGLVTEGILERRRTIELIEACQTKTGRHTTCISDQLRKFWTK
ncbi:uncharacterized protein BO80DRAFT_467405 [Aspergillus ibericus CBS 121593]|uniref:Zn(2)-C6 fungal-type domain-containing protein n=1 Tax=Aspergillus ibericus CBS 121593 TaxID=1448316 RepID=A0A395GR69_9EURO|nr:hypothetical protein BO80DRAFT_467405 [Aspergillus ibericus CBS 121593]RAK97959.1 hypothetical protein BO80DRAFT_467405 [Aspergillus ibericus CBS 121593]